MDPQKGGLIFSPKISVLIGVVCEVLTVVFVAFSSGFNACLAFERGLVEGLGRVVILGLFFPQNSHLIRVLGEISDPDNVDSL